MRRVLKHKLFKVVCAALIILSVVIAIRLAMAQHEINTAPVIITDISKSGYTPEGVYGHGNLIGPDAGQHWYIYDRPSPDGLVQKVCTKNTSPEPAWDIDFIYHKGVWYKLRTGTAEMRDGEMHISPARIKWKGFLQTKTAFPVNRPDLPYRLKIVIAKLKFATLSPKEYVASLKASNPVCADIPAP